MEIKGNPIFKSISPRESLFLLRKTGFLAISNHLFTHFPETPGSDSFFSSSGKSFF